MLKWLSSAADSDDDQQRSAAAVNLSVRGHRRSPVSHQRLCANLISRLLQRTPPPAFYPLPPRLSVCQCLTRGGVRMDGGMDGWLVGWLVGCDLFCEAESGAVSHAAVRHIASPAAERTLLPHSGLSFFLTATLEASAPDDIFKPPSPDTHTHTHTSGSLPFST